MMFPWPAMLRTAVRVGVSPPVFWQLSLREWRWLAGGEEAPTLSGLKALMAAFPDEKDRIDD